jgi:hypothetical protein
MKRTLYLLALLAVVLVSCEQEPSLQKYFVENGDKKDFVTLDIAPTFINADSLDLTADEKTALESLHKFNILAFKSTKTNGKEYAAEKEKVKTLIKTEYDELMKVNSGDAGVSINTKGEGEHIEEFVVFVHQKDNGFGVMRVLGDDMTPANVFTIVQLLQKANINMEQLKPLQALMKKN